MDATVKLEKRMTFTGVADSGHEVKLDSDPSVGGDDQAPRPMELILMGLAGCTAMDVISIMRKKREEVTGFEVQASAERSADHPKVFTKIQLHYVFRGKNIKPNSCERAIELSEEIYCPAQAMLAQVAEISNSYEIIEEE